MKRHIRFSDKQRPLSGSQSFRIMEKSLSAMKMRVCDIPFDNCIFVK